MLPGIGFFWLSWAGTTVLAASVVLCSGTCAGGGVRVDAALGTIKAAEVSANTRNALRSMARFAGWTILARY